MIEWIMKEAAGHYFFYAFPICLLVLFILLKGRRIRFILPSVILTLVIVNPWFFQWWDDLGLYAYWRILWMVPVVLVAAAVIPGITERVKTAGAGSQGEASAAPESAERKPMPAGPTKIMITAIGIAGIVFGGSFVYGTKGGQFEIPGANSTKVPDHVVQIADRLLELNEHPRVILQDPLGVYIRQYTGEIVTMYGRDINGYILNPSTSAMNTYYQVQTGDFLPVSEVMLNDEYDYLVVNDGSEERKQRLTENNFELIDHIAGYGIYQANGRPTKIKEKNEAGQVLSVTYVDENGTAVNGPDGYSRISYDYDQNGYVIKEFRTDTEGNGAVNSKGLAGYQREVNSRGKIVMEQTLGEDGKVKSNPADYAEVRREYNADILTKETYFDEQGNPVNRTDKLYAAVTFERDEAKHAIREQYWDLNGDPVRCSDGYAEVRREYGYDGKLLIRETYYDTQGHPVNIYKGYAGFVRTYDETEHITSESYENENGEPAECFNGYAREEREYDGRGNLVSQRYYDAQDKPVEIYTGYAEVRREYDGLGHVIHERYFGSDGQPKYMKAGYAAIEQAYDDTGRLTIRKYLDGNGQPITRTDGYSETRWAFNETTGAYDVAFYTGKGKKTKTKGLNLAIDAPGNSGQWSAWMTPKYNTDNSTRYIGTVNLGDKQTGDIYSCQIEIEFRDVKATANKPFRFQAQGAADGLWGIGNVWDGGLLRLETPPHDGVYTYTVKTKKVNEKMVGVTTFDIGFRCDYWESGMFRVRKIKIEKGGAVSKWTPGI